ncbi:MAG: hypothetical protein A3J76_02460 [Candidatus Moranbacteria bacterium RBG_13_45_13]|nr:MAG: hypothetical protein A3J76_02460 [Candidatus Moranbacteria bacterium RBG_13_45_13]
MLKYLFLGTIIILPLQFALNISENVDLVVTRILVPAVFLLWLVRSLAKKRIWIPNRAETWLLLSFLFLAAVSLWGGLNWEKGARKILYLFSIIPIYFVGADLARDERFQTKIARAILASGTLAAAVGLIQFVLPFILGLDATLGIWKKLAEFFLGNSFGELVAQNPSWLVNVSGVTWMRAFGFFPDPHSFSFFVALAMFSSLGYFVWEKNIAWRVFAGVGITLMFCSITLSFSRGAYLGTLTGSIFFLLFVLKRAGKLGKVVLAGAVILSLVAVFFRGPVQGRLVSAFNFREGSNAERMKNWQQAADIIENYPLTGIGLGNYSSYVDPMSAERSPIYAHDIFLDLASETGIAGGAVFLLLLLFGIWRGISSKKILGLGLATSLVYFLVHGIFDTPIWSPQVMVILLVILALGLHINNAKCKYQNEK